MSQTESTDAVSTITKPKRASRKQRIAPSAVPKSDIKRSPSAYGEHMRAWMKSYKESGFKGNTKEFFAQGARGWKAKSPAVTEIKKKARPKKAKAASLILNPTQPQEEEKKF